MAEVVTCGVYDIAVPENWYVDLFYSEGDDKGLLELRKNPTTPVQTLYVRSSKLEDATVAATPEALSTYMEMTASLCTIADKAVDGAVADTGYMMLRDGGMAWRGIYENEEGTTFGRLVTVCGDESATVSIFAKDGDQQPSFVRFLLSPVTESEQEQDVWSLLAEKHSYAEAAEKKYYANGAKGLLLYRDGIYGGEAVAAAEAVVLHENRLISMKAMLLHEDEETVKAFVEALLFEEAESNAVQLGELTVYFPDGLTPEEITSENSLAAIKAYDSEKMVQVEMNMLFENMRSFMMEVGEQTMLEIYLSAVVNEISGVDGITIEYTPEHQGMAMVRTSYLDNCIGRGAAFLLDGDTWYVVLVWGGETEADGMELLNEALGYAE